MKNYLLIATFLLINGCSSLSPKSIEQTKTNRYFVLHEKVEQTGVYGIGVTWAEGLMPGKYVSIGIGRGGEYFLGPKACFFISSEGLEPGYNMGGVWIPNDRTKSPYFFRVGGTAQRLSTSDAGMLVNSSVEQGHSHLATGIGVGLGVGIVNSMIAADNGKLVHDRKIHDTEIVNKIFASLDSDKSVQN